MDKFIRTIRAIIMFTLLVIILIFCFQNSQAVDIAFFKMKIQQLPLYIALFGTLSTGLLIGFLAGMISGTKSKRKTLEKGEKARENGPQPTTKETETKNPA